MNAERTASSAHRAAVHAAWPTLDPFILHQQVALRTTATRLAKDFARLVRDEIQRRVLAVLDGLHVTRQA